MSQKNKNVTKAQVLHNFPASLKIDFVFFCFLLILNYSPTWKFEWLMGIE